MSSRANGFGHLKSNRIVDMQIFDRLPSDLRHFVRDAPASLAMEYFERRWATAQKKGIEPQIFIKKETRRLSSLLKRFET